MITYKDGPGFFNIHVFLDGKRVGSIVKTSAGWQYKAGMGVQPHQLGEVFPTLAQCKESLQ